MIFFSPVILSFPVFHAFSTMASSRKLTFKKPVKSAPVVVPERDPSQVTLKSAPVVVPERDISPVTVIHLESERDSSDHDETVAPSSGRKKLTADALSTIPGLSSEQISQILALQPKPKLERKTPDGLVNIRQGVMQIMGYLNVLEGFDDFLLAVYSFCGGNRDDGPMPCSSKVCIELSKFSQIYDIWKNISVEYKKLGLGRKSGSRGKNWFLNRTAIFVASWIIILSKYSLNCSILSSTVRDLSTRDFDSIVSVFEFEHFNEDAEAVLETKCSHLTLKGSQCTRKATADIDGTHYCTQHAKMASV